MIGHLHIKDILCKWDLIDPVTRMCVKAMNVQTVFDEY